MSVATFDPVSEVVTLTQSALSHLRTQIGSRAGVRLGIRRAGCSGYMYELELVDAPTAQDRAIDIDGVTVFVAEDAVPLLRGTEVDYVQSGLNATLRFRNPNASAECGCGESFAVD